MREGPRHLCGAWLALVLLAFRLHAAPPGTTLPQSAEDMRPPAEAADTGTQPRAVPSAGPASEDPHAFLIYLKDGSEPLVVPRYVEENGEIRFEKYGGWIGIPTYEILKIVPDEPDRNATLPSLAPGPDVAEPPQVESSDLYLTLRDGGNLKVTGITPEGERMRVSVPDGSFTVPRSEILGVVRVPSGPDTPEAWISIVMTRRTDDAPVRSDDAPARTEVTEVPEARVEPPKPEPTRSAPGRSAAAASGPSLPYPSSDRPHFVRLSNGQLMRLEGFWVEDGQLRFRRLGGIIGVALTEVLRLIPEEIAPVPGRTQVRFAQQLGPNLIEVRVQSGVQRVRLLGVTPVNGTRTDESPWRHLERGTIIYLEFDRQRYDAEGNWLAYVFLPNNRMLNAELIRLGLARPLADGRNIRYLDLFHELATGDLPDGAATLSRSN